VSDSADTQAADPAGNSEQQTVLSKFDREVVEDPPTTRRAHQARRQGLKDAVLRALREGGLAVPISKERVAERASALLGTTVTPKAVGQALSALAANDLVKYRPKYGWAAVENPQPIAFSDEQPKPPGPAASTGPSPLGYLLQRALETATDEETIRRLTPARMLLNQHLASDLLGRWTGTAHCHQYLTELCFFPVTPDETTAALDQLVNEGLATKQGPQYTSAKSLSRKTGTDKPPDPPPASQHSREQLLAGLLGGIPTDECLLVDRPGSRVAIVLPDGSPFYDQEGASIRVQIWRQ